MGKCFYILCLLFFFYSCQNTEEKGIKETKIIIEKDTSTIKKLDDSTENIAAKILAYEHNFNLALIKKIRDKGLKRGMIYCNPEKLNQFIKSPYPEIERVSLQPINLSNKVNKEEETIIQSFLRQRLPYTPLQQKDYLYYPIQVSNTMCLACHGRPYLDIEGNIYTRIKDQYTSDPKAYQLKEIIGYWKIKQI